MPWYLWLVAGIGWEMIGVGVILGLASSVLDWRDTLLVLAFGAVWPVPLLDELSDKKGGAHRR